MAFKRTILFSVSNGAILISSLSVAATEKLMAKNKQWGLQAIAQTSNGQWCEKNITIHYEVDKSGFFEGNHAEVFTKKLIKLIRSKCAIAESLSVNAFLGSDEKVFKKQALKSTNWRLEAIPFQAKDAKPTQADIASNLAIDDEIQSKIEALNTCKAQYETGDHKKTLQSCSIELIATNRNAMDLIFKSVEREELRVDEIAKCQDFVNTGSNFEVTEACDTEVLRGVPIAISALKNLDAREVVLQEQLLLRTARYEELKSNFRNEIDSWKLGKQLSRKFEKMSRKGRLSQLVEGSGVISARKVTVYSLLTQKEVSDQGYYLTKVTGIEDDRAISSTPYPMDIFPHEQEITDEGWYLVSGILTADETVFKNGKIVSELALENFYKCELDECAEADDVFHIVRLQEDMSDWENDKAPLEPSYDSILDDEFPELTDIPL